MKAENFVYWLQGFFEITGEPKEGLTLDQIRIIRNHLNMVFIHDIDPKMGDKEHQTKLNDAHLGMHKPMTYQEAFVKFGSCPHEGWELSPMHGWFDPKIGRPRC